jgi:hypothetical protein
MGILTFLWVMHSGTVRRGSQALDLSLDAGSLQSLPARRAFQALLRTYFEQGGLQIQVNGQTASHLRAAIAQPEAHAVQQEMIARFEAGL